MLKRKELASTTSCLNKAGSNEPIFVLRAKDPTAPQTIRLWAAMAEGVHETKKIEEALKLADEMDAYRAQNFPGVAAVSEAAGSDTNYSGGLAR